MLKCEFVYKYKAMPRFCIHDKCKTTAHYGKAGTNIRKYCVRHMQPGYVCLTVNKKCIHPNCDMNLHIAKQAQKLEPIALFIN